MGAFAWHSRKHESQRRKGETEMVPGRESEQVDEEVTGWVEVRRRTRRRVVQEGHEDSRREELQDGPHLRQDGWVQNNRDGCGTERQSQ